MALDRAATVEHIRNFVIIAHVDHGKSTLADRFLELTGTVEPRRMQPQYLDRMDLERERGITIKMQPVRMRWRASGEEYILNLIDTPGHADFAYEVSRALAAVEGAILLVDAAQGVEAQTVANFELARREGLALIPVLNKIDLRTARLDETAAELGALVGCDPGAIRRISAKTGQGVPELLDAVTRQVPPPRAAAAGAPARGLVFDSHFDAFRGVVAHVRVVDGSFARGQPLLMLASASRAVAAEVGYFAPAPQPTERLESGEIGYLATGLKEPETVRVGDTVTTVKSEIRNKKSDIGRVEALAGYREPEPVVFASAYPEDADEYPKLLDGLKKVRLSDAALSFAPEASEALGRGFRLGCLGMLHLEIVSERLRREHGVALIMTVPSVAYRVRRQGGTETVASAAHFPDGAQAEEPWVRLEVLTPLAALGAVSTLLGAATRGRFLGQDHLGAERVALRYEAPLADILTDFADDLKSVSAGYASFSYELAGYRPADLLRLNVLVAGQAEPALARVVAREAAYREGRAIVGRLKELLPRQVFAVPVQASAGGRVIARETVPALKKNVTGYLYGGDRTRKMKLWAKQKRGQARLRHSGRVEIPADVFRRLLARASPDQP